MSQFESAGMYTTCQNFLAQQIISLKAVIFLCALMGVLRPTIQGRIIEVMYTACLLSTIYRKLPYKASFAWNKTHRSYLR
jgi:hypothetical protein